MLTKHFFAPMTEAEILAAPMVDNPLTQYMVCSPGEGAVAARIAEQRSP